MNLLDFDPPRNEPKPSNEAFALALDCLHSIGGGRLYLPRGTYFFEAEGLATAPYFEAVENRAIKIDFSNLVIEGDGPGLTILKVDKPTTTLLYVAGPGIQNITLRNLTLEQPDATEEWDHCATTLKRKGLDPSKATSVIDQGWTLGTVAYFLGTPGSYLRNLTIENVEVTNASRHAIGFGYVSGASFRHNIFNYYDGIKPAEHTQTAEGAGRCGIFAGSEPVYDVLIQGNRFNGNCCGNAPRFNPDGTASFMAADGFVWMAKGGNHTVANNLIRNFGLEACHHAAGSLSVEGNQFITACSTPSTLACLAYANTPRPEDIETPLYVFRGNTVKGCTIGLMCKPPTWVYNPAYATPRFRVSATDNDFIGVDYPFSAIGVDNFHCANNTVDTCKQFFGCTVDPTFPANLDLRCKDLIFANNDVRKATNIAILLNTMLQNGGLLSITGGSMGRGDYHLLTGVPKPGETYYVKLGKDVVWFDPAGKPVPLPFTYPIPPGKVTYI